MTPPPVATAFLQQTGLRRSAGRPDGFKKRLNRMAIGHPQQVVG